MWITGASAGLGRALALRMAAAGWTVAASARSADSLAELEQASGGKIMSFPLDILDNAAVAETLKKLRSTYGKIDIAVLNAGTHIPVQAKSLKASAFQKLADLNLVGTANCLEHLLPPMIERKGGQIAIVASVAGYRGLPTSAAYGMTKAGLINMAEALKPELDFYGIKMQVVCPGFIRTPLTDKNDFEMPDLMEPEAAAEEFYQGLLGNKFEITFPKKFTRKVKLLGMLPYGIAFKAARKLVAERMKREAKAKEIK